MATLTKAQILAADDRKTELVEVPGWGGSVNVRGIGGGDRDQFDAWRLAQYESKNGDRFRNTRARLCAMAIVDDDGKRVFSDADIAALGEKSTENLDRVYLVARRLSGLGDEALEQAEKNSETGPSAGSGSA